MSVRLSTMLVGGLAASCLAGGVAVAAVAGGASAEPAHTRPAPATVADSAAKATTEQAARPAPRSRGVASMSSPYIPDVPHVPADVLLVLGPDGSAEGARYVGPAGSLFNGPVHQVERRVDAWWAEQMAAGVTPEEADRRLAHPRG